MRWKDPARHYGASRVADDTVGQIPRWKAACQDTGRERNLMLTGIFDGLDLATSIPRRAKPPGTQNTADITARSSPTFSAVTVSGVDPFDVDAGFAVLPRRRDQGFYYGDVSASARLDILADQSHGDLFPRCFQASIMARHSPPDPVPDTAGLSTGRQPQPDVVNMASGAS